MSIRPHPHRIPRARIDPITDAATALRLIRLAMALPPRDETLVLLLDDAHRGLSVASIDDTPEPDHAVGVVEFFTDHRLADAGLGAIVVASIRPGGGPVDGDGDRWFEMCDLADEVGVELLEWFVVGRSVSCPRDLVGAPPRWSTPGARSA